MTNESNAESPGESQPEHKTRNKGNHHNRSRDERMTDPPYEERSIRYQEDSQEEEGPLHRGRGTCGPSSKYT